MTTTYKSVHKLKVAEDLLAFVNNELFKDTKIVPEKFWKSFSETVHILAEKNRNLIKTREKLQKEIDNWHVKNRGKKIHRHRS